MHENYICEISEQKKRAVVILGRFNPPHLGHYGLIDTAKKYIRDNKALNLEAIPILVIVDGKETSKNKKNNPLSVDERITFIQSSGKANGVKILSASDAFKAFEVVRASGYEPIVIIAGADRNKKYIEILDKYFVGTNGENIQHYGVEVQRNNSDNSEEHADILKYMDADIPANMISGSLARAAVLNDEFEKFCILVGLSHNKRLAKLMFNKIKLGIENGTS